MPSRQMFASSLPVSGRFEREAALAPRDNELRAPTTIHYKYYRAFGTCKLIEINSSSRCAFARYAGYHHTAGIAHAGRLCRLCWRRRREMGTKFPNRKLGRCADHGKILPLDRIGKPLAGRSHKIKRTTASALICDVSFGACGGFTLLSCNCPARRAARFRPAAGRRPRSFRGRLRANGSGPRRPARWLMPW